MSLEVKVQAHNISWQVMDLTTLRRIGSNDEQSLCKLSTFRASTITLQEMHMFQEVDPSEYLTIIKIQNEMISSTIKTCLKQLMYSSNFNFRKSISSWIFVWYSRFQHQHKFTIVARGRIELFGMENEAKANCNSRSLERGRKSSK